jgi:hypothetical protein
MIFSATNLVTETATDITASSANPNFPVSNLSNQLRSKRWRSSGTFIISTANNKINFKESAMGLELTATLSSGSYSPSELCTEIKSQMESVGAATYTVSYSTSTGLWAVATDGSYLSLLNLTGTNQLANVFKLILGFPNLDKTGSLTYTGSLIAIHTMESIVFDLKTTQDISAIAVMWPKEDGIRLSTTAVVKLEANATDDWSSPAISTEMYLDDIYLVSTIFYQTPETYRYWRVTIEDARNPDLYVEIGTVWIGENLDFNEPENGFKFKLEDKSKEMSNDFGHSYFDEYPQEASLDFSYSYVDYTTAQSLDSAFRSNGKRKPVLVAIDDTEAVFNKNHFFIYGLMDKTFELKHVSYDLFKGGFKITELG